MHENNEESNLSQWASEYPNLIGIIRNPMMHTVFAKVPPPASENTEQWNQIINAIQSAESVISTGDEP